jgi:hypothetical protein
MAEHISLMLRMLTANACFAIQHVFARTGERPFKPGTYLACMIGAGLANVGLIGEVLWLNNLGVVMNLLGTVYAALPD